MTPQPIPNRPSKFQISNQWLEFYEPALKYGAKIDASQVIGDSTINIEDSGLPFGSFGTLDFVAFTLVDNGNGTVSIQSTAPGSGVILQENGTPLSASPFVTLNFVGATLTDDGGAVSTITITADGSTINWATVNWTNFFDDVDWSDFTDWATFVTSLTTNWTTSDWNTFTTEFFNNLSESEIDTFIELWNEDNFGTFITQWVANVNATDWNTFIDAFVTNADEDDVQTLLDKIDGDKGDILVNDGTNWNLLPVGTDGQVLAADSAETNGVKWEDKSTGFTNNIISGTFKSLASVVIDSIEGSGGNTLRSPLIFIGLLGNNINYHTGVSSAFSTQLSTGQDELIIRNGQIDLEINIEDVPPVSVPGATCTGFCIDGQYAYLTLNSGNIYRVDVTSYTPNSGVLMTISGGTLTGATASSRIAVRDGIAYFARQSGNLIEKYTVSGTTFTYVGVFSIASVTDIAVNGLEKIAIGKNGWVMFRYNIAGGDYRTALLDGSGNLIRNEVAANDPYYCFSIDDVFLSTNANGTSNFIKVNYIQ